MPPPCWLLCSSRTGSYFLCELLNNTGVFLPLRFDDTLWEYHSVQELRDKPLFTARAEDHRFLAMRPTLQDVLEAVPGVHFLLLKRHNLLRRAVSLYIARNVDCYHIWDQDTLARCLATPIPCDPAALMLCYNWLKSTEGLWEVFLQGHPVFTVEYDDLCSDPVTELGHIFEYLGCPQMDFGPTIWTTNQSLLPLRHPVADQCLTLLSEHLQQP